MSRNVESLGRVCSVVRRLAVLSFHTSPLTQPGAGDGGGMNVYVRELSSALAGAGVECEVFTRSWRRGLAPIVEVEPGFRVHHVPAGPEASVAKEDLPAHVEEFTAGVLDRIDECGPADVIHANYWLSGVAGHTLKHRLELPLVSTFHTLARVKAEEAAEEHDRRAKAEAEVIGCCDAILASSAGEAAQLERLYGAVPERIEIVPPGVDHHLFTPGDQRAARAPRLSPGEKKAWSTPGGTISMRAGSAPYSRSSCCASAMHDARIASEQPMTSASASTRRSGSGSPVSALTRANVWNVDTSGRSSSCLMRCPATPESQ